MRRPITTARSITAASQLANATGGGWPSNHPWWVSMRTAPSGRPRPLAEMSLEDAAEVRGGTSGTGTGMLLAD